MWNKKFSDQFLNNLDHLQNRPATSLKNSFITNLDEATSLFLLSPSDIGVIKNGGRLGSKWGPQAIINTLKKASISNKNFKIGTTTVTDFDSEQENFQESQKKQAKLILKNISLLPISAPNLPPHFHFGGGHDHIFALGLGLLSHPEVKELLIINLDPHLDTRDDQIAHSGTPFRQLANEAKNCQKIMECIEWGTGVFCNPKSSYQNLENKYFQLKIWNESSEHLADYLNNYVPKDGQHIILSLDCDMIHASLMEAVSAPAWDGAPLVEIESIMKAYLKMSIKNHLRPFIGLYEYNPLFDNLSMKGAKAISSLIYKALSFNYY